MGFFHTDKKVAPPKDSVEWCACFIKRTSRQYNSHSFRSESHDYWEEAKASGRFVCLDKAKKYECKVDGKIQFIAEAVVAFPSDSGC